MCHVKRGDFVGEANFEFFYLMYWTFSQLQNDTSSMKTDQGFNAIELYN